MKRIIAWIVAAAFAFSSFGCTAGNPLAGQGPGGTPEETGKTRTEFTVSTPSPAPSSPPQPETLYRAYLKDVLLPRYGLSNMQVVRYLQQSGEPLGADDRSLGLMGAQLADLNGDGLVELIVAACEKRPADGVERPDHMVTLLVFTLSNGIVTRVPGAEDGLVSVVSDETTAYFGSAYSLDIRAGADTLIYSCYTGSAGDTDWQEFLAFRMVDGKLIKVLDAVNYLSAGEYGVVAAVLPDWLNGDFSGVTRQLVQGFGEDSVLLYAEKDPMEEEFHVFQGEYRVVYQSHQAALEALLRPIDGAPIRPMLDPLWQDQTRLCEWLGVPAPTFTPPAPTPAPLEDFILQGRNRRYAYEELNAYAKEEVALIRNGMYALSGIIFEKEENRNFFSQFSWYAPALEDVESLLNATQRANIALCVQYETDHGWR